MNRYKSVHVGMALAVVIAAGLVSGCSQDIPNRSGGGSGLSLDGLTLARADLFQGCSGVDCIPSVDAPRFAAADAPHRVSDYELVVGVVVDGQAYAFPYAVMNWHEVVNFTTSGGERICMSYCPLTSSSVAFRRSALPGAPEFGVSGLLWRSNLIMYDRGTNGLWSQMRLGSVQGQRAGEDFDLVGTFEMTWGSWRAIHPTTMLLTRSTGAQRNYDRYPYFDYWTNDLFFIPQPFSGGDPVAPHYHDDRVDAKLRVHGIRAGGRSVAFAMTGQSEAGLDIDNALVGGVPVLVLRGDTDPGNAELELAHSLERTVGDQVLIFKVAPETIDTFPWLLLDNETGTRWTLTGDAVSGPLLGHRLRPTASYNSFWFAWVGFWPDTFLKK